MRILDSLFVFSSWVATFRMLLASMSKVTSIRGIRRAPPGSTPSRLKRPSSRLSAVIGRSP